MGNWISDHPQIEQTIRTGYPDFKEVTQVMEENRYIEDVFGTEIKIGDTYYENEHEELIHESNLIVYAKELLIKKTR